MTASRRGLLPLLVTLSLPIASFAQATTLAPHAATAPVHATAAKPHAATAKPAATSTATVAERNKRAGQLAQEARIYEEAEAWGSAAQRLRALRDVTAPDADLELMRAWCEARSGRVDSAAAILDRPPLATAGDDSMPVARWREYPWAHEGAWLNGHFDGWHWYVWRTRAELAIARGRWDEALAAQRRATAARPLVGKEWHVQALCAARLGRWEDASAWDSLALVLDPTLPDAHYLSGLMAWRTGRRNDAQQHFRAAVGLDSLFREPAIAMLRVRMLGSSADTLPAEPFSGLRRVSWLTAPDGPKPEVFMQMQLAANLRSKVDADVVVPNGILPHGAQRTTLAVSMLIDGHGHVVLNDVPHYATQQLDPAKVSAILATLPRWRFDPAMRDGQPHPVWVGYEYVMKP